MPKFNNVVELKKVHSDYQKNLPLWTFYKKAYDGGREFIDIALKKQPKESDDNFELRKNEACNFNYCQTIVNIFHQFVSEKQPEPDTGSLEEDEQWQWFYKNCDINGSSFIDFFNDIEKLSSVYGFMGILTNKPQSSGIKAEELSNRIYPYLMAFNPFEIYDFEFEHDYITGKNILNFVKLRVHKGTKSEKILYMDLDVWELYEIKEGKLIGCIDQGKNRLKEVPFVFHFNMRSIDDPTTGISDIKEAALINASVTRNLSCIEEITKNAAFPILRMPEEESYGAVDDNDDDEPQEEIVGVKSVLDFDPQYGNDGKPDWMEAKVQEPIEAILVVIEKKVEEMYRTKHISNLYSSKARTQYIKSGTAMEYDFKQLKSVLSKKVDNSAATKLKIIELWLKWQNMEELLKDVTIDTDKNFNIEKLLDSLDTTMGFINGTNSKKIRKLFYRVLVPRMLPNVTEEDLQEIEEEIDKEPDELKDYDGDNKSNLAA